ncbi:MAG TPA: serine/threonine-protein kinase [Kofleriaceae bacterium]|nr:serine/threonine-protein kinase [Kofleriaceae bacterium]
MHELPATFGKYYLTEKLATGGMAEIYLAKILGPAGFEKQLVIKQIHPKLSGQRHFVDLFVAEAKILVSLAHGNIVPVYELGVVDDIYFIAMEYIDGPTLYRVQEAVWRAGGLIAPPLATWLAGEILDGLDYAHRKGEGVIHRDLSPRNVMLSRDGEVKLVDFGIAVALDAGAEDETDGAPTGSFPYMSPEQVRRQKLTGQSDLFSVSVLLWEMLTGRRLFARSNADDTLKAVLEAKIEPPSRLRPEVSPKLDEIVMRGLAREAADRWSNAAEYLAALNRYLYTLDPVPGARDLAALIARYCPPERALTEGGGHTMVEQPDDAGHTMPHDGPATLVHARGDHELTTPVKTQPRGKRPGTVREQSFATHVDFERVLARATPLFPIAAIRDEDLPPSVEVAREAAQPSPETTLEIERQPRPGSPRWGAWLVLAAIAAGIAIVVWYARRPGAKPIVAPAIDAAINPDAPIVIDAPIVFDAAPPPPDAPRGALPPARDAGTRPPPPDARPTSRATAKLKVGASPWGEVYLDGQKLGNAPHEWDVPAGHHTVVVRFPAPNPGDPPQEKTFDVDLAAGANPPLQADFTP